MFSKRERTDELDLMKWWASRIKMHSAIEATSKNSASVAIMDKSFNNFGPKQIEN